MAFNSHSFIHISNLVMSLFYFELKLNCSKRIEFDLNAIFSDKLILGVTDSELKGRVYDLYSDWLREQVRYLQAVGECLIL